MRHLSKMGLTAVPGAVLAASDEVSRSTEVTGSNCTGADVGPCAYRVGRLLLLVTDWLGMLGTSLKRIGGPSLSLGAHTSSSVKFARLTSRSAGTRQCSRLLGGPHYGRLRRTDEMRACRSPIQLPPAEAVQFGTSEKRHDSGRVAVVRAKPDNGAASFTLATPESLVSPGTPVLL